MSRPLSRAAPIRFLIGVTLVWTVGRGAVLMGWQPPVPDHPVAVTDRAIAKRQGDPASSDQGSIRPYFASLSSHPSRDVVSRAASHPTLLAAGMAMPSLPTPTEGRSLERGSTYQTATGATEASAIIPETARRSRLSGSAWVFARGGGRATVLSPGGQIGGGQAGARLLYRLDQAGRVSATARLSTTLGGARQSEASLGFDWKPVSALPVHLTVERRVAIDKGGRNAWTAGLSGGVYALPIATHWRLDGYGEAGVVGAHRRDLYADGAARIGRTIDLGDTSLTLGPGVWGAAQPGAARLDVGPSAVLRLPIDRRTIAVALDWRERIAGRARPGSGVALTLAADF